MKKPYKKKTDSEKKPFSEIVSERLIEALQKNLAPWQKPWQPGEVGLMPMNPVSGVTYKGINRLMLMLSGFSDNRWMTFKQAAEVGAHVRKGEKGTQIQYWSFEKRQTKFDESGSPVKGADGKDEKETVKLNTPRVFTAFVFNVEQIEGLPAELLVTPEPKEVAWSPDERAEAILKRSGANFTHINGDRAYYQPATDKFVLPEPSQFSSMSAYYATALHELAHWSGHKSRLNRDLSGSFGSESYAKEELRAEIASMILGEELRLGHNPDNHASYVKSWIKILQDDHLEIFRAASDAEKIKNFILGFELEKDLSSESEHDLDEDSGLDL